MAKKKTADEAKFTNEVKIKFLGCDSAEKLEAFLSEYEIDSLDNSGNNILHYYLNNIGAFSLNWEIIIPCILKKGLDINRKQAKGAFERSPLHISVFAKEKDISKYLIEMGADVNSTDKNGNSILFTAVMWYREQDGYFIELLLKHGADIYLENQSGISAIGLADSIASNDVAKFFKDFDR